VPKDDESHIEHFKRQAVKAVKQAAGRKNKDADHIRLLVEEDFTMGHQYVLGSAIAVLKFKSDRILVLSSKQTNGHSKVLPLISSN
jgi:hypothetical protein